MLKVDDLPAFADELRERGFDAMYEVIFTGQRFLEGLDLDDDFFPLWELVLPENEAALERLDFAAIKARRAANWTPHPPSPNGC